MKKFLFVVMMTLPLLGWSQEKIDCIDFTSKSDTVKVYGVPMGDIIEMFAQAELVWCEVYEVDPEQKGKIAVWETPKGEKLLLVSEEYTAPRYCITTYFEISYPEKSIWIGFESRNQYPRLFEKLDKKIREAYPKKPQ